VYRFKTFEELWAGFKKAHPVTHENYIDKERPNLAPRVFRENAPFEMKKVHDTGCLCIHCEGMNELRRESKGAASQIEAICNAQSTL